MKHDSFFRKCAVLCTFALFYSSPVSATGPTAVVGLYGEPDVDKTPVLRHVFSLFPGVFGPGSSGRITTSEGNSFDLWDIANAPRFESMAQASLRNADIIVLCVNAGRAVDATRKAVLEKLTQFCKNAARKDPEIIVVGRTEDDEEGQETARWCNDNGYAYTGMSISTRGGGAGRVHQSITNTTQTSLISLLDCAYSKRLPALMEESRDQIDLTETTKEKSGCC